MGFPPQEIKNKFIPLAFSNNPEPIPFRMILAWSSD